jgi:hypothetical protein
MKHIPASKLLLKNRAKEVLRYLRFLSYATNLNADVSVINPSLGKEYPLRRDLTHTLKANLYLLLYSAIEASLVQLLDEINEVIVSHKLSADVLQEELLVYVVRQFKANPTDLTIENTALPVGNVVMTFWANNPQVSSKLWNCCFDA